MFFCETTVSRLQFPAHHVLDLYHLKMDRGVFFGNVSPVSVLTLKSLELMRYETGRHWDFSSHRPET